MKKILVVDDDANFLSALTAQLALGDNEVDRASTGREALEHIKEHNPDLVVLDLNLPDIQGIDIMSSSIEDKHAKQTKFVICTNYGTAMSEKECKELGAQEYILKTDFTIEELVKKIENALN